MLAPSIAAELQSALPQAHSRRARPLVFLAEDDAHLRRTVADALREAGFDVLSASSGYDMLKLLTASARGDMPAPDAMVMDIRMPRCSGIDVLAALRLAEWRQPVVMITAFGDPELHERAASYGASVVLDKPFDADDLVGMLDVLLRLAHARVLPRPDADADADVAAAAADDEPEPETLRCP